MSLEEIKKHINNPKHIFNNLNDYIIQIDYFDQNGLKKRKNRIPLKYIFDSKSINAQRSI